MELIEKEHLESFGILFDHIYKGDEEAKKLSFEILEFVHIWDDLYDKDKEVSPNQVNYAFFNAIYSFQKNPLWQRCNITEHMLGVVLRWKAANVLEAEHKSEDDLNKAYMLRAGIYDVFVVIAFHLYGDAWAEEVTPVIYRFYGEKLQQFKEEIKHA